MQEKGSKDMVGCMCVCGGWSLFALHALGSFPFRKTMIDAHCIFGLNRRVIIMALLNHVSLL